MDYRASNYFLYSILNSCFFYTRKKKAMCFDDNTKIYALKKRVALGTEGQAKQLSKCWFR